MRRRTLLQAATAVGTIGALSACAPGGGGGNEETKQPADVKTDIGSLVAITLTVWDQEVRGGQKEQIDALNEAFQKKYSNVTIKRVTQSFDDLKKQVSLALSGNDVPDVCQINNARADMGAFVKAGQLANLTPYAEAYKWADRFPSSVLAKVRYSNDAVTFGEGELWGLPQTGEIVGIFYSQKALDKLGAVPTTWDEYYALLDKAKQQGLQPMTLGNIEKWPALHVFGPLQAAFTKAEDVVKLGMGNKGADWASDTNVAALTKFGDWAKQSYFGPSPNGLDYDAAWADFTKGKAAFIPGGSWLGTDMAKVMGDDLRFMAPPPGVDGKLATTGGTGIPFAVPAKAKNKDAAAAYIDFITNAEAMTIIADKGGMPVLDTAKLAPKSGVNKDIYEAFDKVSKEGTLLPYLDYATPTFADTCGNALQELIGGRADAKGTADKLQKDYAAFTG